MKIIPFILLAVLFSGCLMKPSSEKNEKSGEESKVLVLKMKPDVFIEKISDKLNETSAMEIYDGLFWTINDSGGKDVVYAFNNEGKIQHEVKLKDAKNDDWEAIAQDDEFFYIGDFGNNRGNRKNLKVYKFSKKDITKTETLEKKADAIRFNYKNQLKYNSIGRNHEFDCEAMFAKDSCLYLFSKDWKNRKTKIYVLPKEEGTYEISPLATWEADGLITGADISPDKQFFALVGYKNYAPFIWLFKWDNEKYFSEKAVRINLKASHDAQTEGICFSNKQLLISCEETKTFPQRVFSIDITEAINYLSN